MHINLPDKRYYKIGEVAKAFNLNTSHIRFWEKEFDIIKPKKNAKGNRLFTKEDINHFKLIYLLFPTFIHFKLIHFIFSFQLDLILFQFLIYITIIYFHHYLLYL